MGSGYGGAYKPRRQNQLRMQNSVSPDKGKSESGDSGYGGAYKLRRQNQLRMQNSVSPDKGKFEECLTYPADAAKCCPHVCNSEHICAGESFENVIDVDAAEDASSNALTECLENTYEPSKFAFWRWGATWRRAKYNKCEKVYAHGYTPETDISVALCCPNNGSAEERRLAANEAEDEDEDAEAAAAPAGVPLYGQELREAACVNGPVTSAPVNPGKPSTTPTKKPSKSSGASTFGFTALAL